MTQPKMDDSVVKGQPRTPKIMATEISLNSRVRILDDVLFQELQGEAVLLNLKTGVYLGLDQLGTQIWLASAGGRLAR